MQPFKLATATAQTSPMPTMDTERFLRKALIVIALVGLMFGLLAWAAGRSDLAKWFWAAGTAPVVIGLLVSELRIAARDP